MKKLLAITLCLVMFLGVLPAMNLTGYAFTKFAITPYENSATGVSGFENWSGPNGMQTQLLICTEAFPQGIDHSIPWTITLYDTRTMDTQTFTRTPDSGSGHWLYRFELCTGEDAVVPELGVTYMVEARVTVNGTEYVGTADGFRVIQTPIIPDDSGDTPNPLPTERTEITLTPLFTAWENWENSPNRGNESAVTQLLVGIKDRQGKVMDIPLDLDWSLHIFPVGSQAGTTLHMAPATKALAYDGLYRFETCLGEGENKFVPEFGVNYEISISVNDQNGKNLYFSNLYSGFYCEIDPIVPGSTTPTLKTEKITLTPLFGAWENWENSPNKGEESAVTQLLVGITDKWGDAVDIPQDADWTVTIEDIFGLNEKNLKLAPATKALVYDGLYRFETVLGDGNDRFIPENSGIYYVKIVAETDTTRYVSDLTGGFICNIDPIIPDGGNLPKPPTADSTEMVLTPLFTAWENWENSPNRGDEDTVTQLLVGIKDTRGNVLDISQDLEWRLQIIDSWGKVTNITLAPATKSLVYDGLYRFETCLGEGKNQFIPRLYEDYIVSISVFEDGEEIYWSTPTAGFYCEIDPIVPGSNTDVNPLAISGEFVKTTYYGESFFCLKLKVEPYHSMALTPSWYDFTCTVTLRDTKGNTYTLTEDDYLYGSSTGEMHFFLLEGIEGIEKGMTYTVSFSYVDCTDELFESREDAKITCNIEPTVDTEEESGEIKIAPVGDGFTNMEVDGIENTFLLVRVTDAVGNDLKLSKGYLYELTISEDGYEEIVCLTPVDIQNGVCYFAPLLEDLYWYIPTKGMSYTITLTIYDTFGEILHESKPTSGFKCNVEPIIPSDFGADWVITPMDPVWSLDKDGNLLLTVKIEDMDGNLVPAPGATLSEWSAMLGRVDDEDFFELLLLEIVSAEDSIFVFKVETESLFGVGGFTPEKNVNYILSIMAYDEESEEMYESGDTEGFVCKTDLKKPSDGNNNDNENKNENENGSNMFDDLFEDDRNKKEDGKGVKTWLVVTIAVSSAVLATIIAVVICVIIMRKKKN